MNGPALPPTGSNAGSFTSSSAGDEALNNGQICNGQICNGMSVDIEDWFQVGAFENTIKRSSWAELDDRVERNVHVILEQFDRAEVKATFFTLGWVAERHKSLLAEIAKLGHEVASHGWDHKRVFTLSPAEFAEDIARTQGLLEDCSGVRVIGYRAPSFSIDKRTPWAFEELAKQGYLYSSSVAPLAHDHYGWAEAPRFAFHPLEGSDLVELPVTTAVFAGKRLAAGGGGFFRVLPYGFSNWAIRQVNGQEGRPAIFYFHPWEVDPDQPRVAEAPLRSKFRHYTNLGKMAGKLDRLLDGFSWGRIDQIAEREKRAIASKKKQAA